MNITEHKYTYHIMDVKLENVLLVYECEENEFEVDESWENWNAEIYETLSHFERLDAWVRNNPFPNEMNTRHIFNIYEDVYNLSSDEKEYLWLKHN